MSRQYLSRACKETNNLRRKRETFTHKRKSQQEMRNTVAVIFDYNDEDDNKSGDELFQEAHAYILYLLNRKN